MEKGLSGALCWCCSISSTRADQFQEVAHPTYTYSKAGTVVKVATTAGTLLILLSILRFSWGGFQFHARAKERGRRIGKTWSTLPIPPTISMAPLIVGIALAAVGMRYKMA